MEEFVMFALKKIGWSAGRLLLVVAACLAVSGEARAVIVFEDPGRLTTMPVLPGGVKPGWQYLGKYGSYTGIPIGPRAWITATHVSGSTGTLTYDNAGTTATGTYASTRAATSGDLAMMVLDVSQPSFTSWAPVWSSTATLVPDQDVYLYGRGTSRGAVATNSDPVPGTPKGWEWGTYDFVQSYGTNQFAGLATVDGNVCIVTTFNQPTGGNGLPLTEGILSSGDSGSGVFSYDLAASQWALLGINYSVDLIQQLPNGPLYEAAIYDSRGYYDGATLITGTAPKPLSSYSTSIPHNYDFIAPYIVPEPATWLLAALAAMLLPACARGTATSGSVAIRAMSVAGKRIPQRPSSVATAQGPGPTGDTSPKPAVVSVEKLSHRKSTQRSCRWASTPPARA